MGIGKKKKSESLDVQWESLMSLSERFVTSVLVARLWEHGVNYHMFLIT